jgi:hypothetical protein
VRRCTFCGSTHNVTNHHVGGANFIAWFTMPLCSRCQQIFHARQRAADIDLRCSPNPRTRFIRAMKMALLFMWMLLDMLERDIDRKPEPCQALPVNSGITK